MTRKILRVATVLLMVGIIQAPMSAQQQKFNLPQQNKTCPADSTQSYDGATYQNIRLGISFQKLKALLDTNHHALSPNRRVQEGILFEYDSLDEWPVGKYKWKPTFSFVDDKGVYRLAKIWGKLGDADQIIDTDETLKNKYGTPNGNDEEHVWKIGENPYTVISLEQSSYGILEFNHHELLGLAIQQKRQQAPGL